MKTAFRLLLFVALAAAGVWLWTVLFPGPEKIIRQRLASLAGTVSASANESDLARLMAAKTVAGFFATNVEMQVEVPLLDRHSSLDREEIASAVLAARSRGGRLKVTFPDLNVTVAPDQQSAVADLTVEAKFSGDRDSLLQEMKFTLRKVDGQWLIIRIETVRILS